MWSDPIILLIAILCKIVLSQHHGKIQEAQIRNITQYCEAYDELEYKKTVRLACSESAGINYCYNLWEYNVTSGKANIKMKGCFSNNRDCEINESNCVLKNKSEDLKIFYCCCDGNYCNRNLNYTAFLIEESQPKNISDEKLIRNETQDFSTSVITFSSLIIICAIIALILISVIRHRPNPYLEKSEFFDTDIKGTSSPKSFTQRSPSSMAEEFTISFPQVVSIAPVEILEKRAIGRFGEVWRGTWKDEDVAVKVFPLRERDSWTTEKSILEMSNMQHPNILKLIGAQVRGEGLDTEFWLISNYYRHGSLYDYLIENVVTWDEFLKITSTMARGLNHIHREMRTNYLSSGYKPPIAHCDFKSRNVLLKDDLSVCIADFGLAVVFDPQVPRCNNRGRVGTLRYMAPEVLDGAVNFNSTAYQSTDMYSCALVLWELVTRCTLRQNIIPDYQSPYDEEVGPHPTLTDMQQCVVTKKCRPEISEAWKTHWGLAIICNSIEDCWDVDPEARLSSSCLLHRIESIRKEQTTTL